MVKSIIALLPLLGQLAVAAPRPHNQDGGACGGLTTRTTIHLSRTVYVTVQGKHVAATGLAPMNTGISEPSGTGTVTNALSTGSAGSNSPSAPTVGRNVLYFTNWSIYGTKFKPQDIPSDQITHLMYAFADIAKDGTVISSDPWSDFQKRYDEDKQGNGTNAFGSVKQLYLQKKKNRKLKTILSIGGWTYSQQGKFSAVGTKAGRQRFATSAVKLLADWGFDGLDIDWEYPTNKKEANDFVKLLKACRQALDRYAADNNQKYHYLLTVAASAGPHHYKVQRLKCMDKYLDAWHLMAYDYAGAWDGTSGHQAGIYNDANNVNSTKFNTNQAVEDYVASGIPPSKIVVGIPLFGRSFKNTCGLGKPFKGVGRGTNQNGVWLYRDLPRPGATEHLHKKVGAAWSYDRSSRELISYDNVESAKLKAKYVKSKGLGGAVFWEASGDRPGKESLVGTMAEEMGELDRSQNMLNYPKSQYVNIKNGIADSW